MSSTRLFKRSNDASIVKEWAGVLDQYGINESNTSADKIAFLSEMAHLQAMGSVNEAYATTPGLYFQRPGSISQMGNPVAPTFNQQPFFGGAKTATTDAGSGDKWPSLLPISIQAAAKTVAFDLLATINMDAPVGFIPYLDYVYQGGNIGTEYEPFLIKTIGITADFGEGSPVFGDTVEAGDEFVLTGGYPEESETAMVFVGFSRVDGSAVFRIMEMANGAASLASVFTPGATLVCEDKGIDIELDEVTCKIDLLSALENHISGFTATVEDDETPWSGNYLPDAKDGRIALPESMRREQGEKAQYRQMGVRMFTKYVEAKTDQIGLSASVEQIQDFNRVWNLDVISMLENIGVNELAQTISKKLTAEIYNLGYLHTKEIAKVEGKGLTDLSLEAFGGFENTSTLQRRVVTKFAEMSNLIYHRSRWGAGEYIVTNGRIAAALADVSGYSFSPFNSKMGQTGGQLYPAGEVYGMKVYVDPNAKWGDTKALIGRRGKDDEPGVKFLPYIMAETIQTISEATMSPKLAIKSRYAITQAGWHPETQYITMDIKGIEKLTGSAPAVANPNA